MPPVSRHPSPYTRHSPPVTRAGRSSPAAPISRRLSFFHTCQAVRPPPSPVVNGPSPVICVTLTV
eukprot:5905221-Karenia_brevis.AAC.1